MGHLDRLSATHTSSVATTLVSASRVLAPLPPLVLALLFLRIRFEEDGGDAEATEALLFPARMDLVLLLAALALPECGRFLPFMPSL